jgi:site-specific DNA recombinase
MPAPGLLMKPTKHVTSSRAVLYARVSSKDQEQEGFSIPAQQRLLREYAATNSITIAAEFVDVETARRAGRDGFGRMLDYLNKHERTVRIVLAEKVDRLYCNIADWVKIDDSRVNVHFVKENTIIGPDSRSNDQLIHGFKVIMARNYSQNLGEETRKGQTEKRAAGSTRASRQQDTKTSRGQKRETHHHPTARRGTDHR